MTLEVFGAGSAQCRQLAAAAKAAADRLGIHYDFCRITKAEHISSRGVVETPALAINGEVKVAGKVPTEDELATIIAAVLARN